MPTYADAVSTNKFGSFANNYNIFEQPGYSTVLEAHGNGELFKKHSTYDGGATPGQLTEVKVEGGGGDEKGGGGENEKEESKHEKKGKGGRRGKRGEGGEKKEEGGDKEEVGKKEEDKTEEAA